MARQAKRCCLFLICTLWCAGGTVAGCTTVVAPAKKGEATELSQRCVPAMTKRARAAPGATHERHAVPTTAAVSQFSPDALHVADVVGVLPILNQIADLTASSRHESIETMTHRQRLTDQILLTLFEVTSSTAELTCERDRADQVADRIDEIDGTRVKRLTIASIVFGGIASIISGGVGLAAGASVGGEVADVAGGVLASWFGVSALFTHSEVDFRHDRNVLQEIWDDPPEPRIFSPTIWRYLHRAQAEGANVPRDQVVNAWRQGGRLGEQGSGDEHERRNLFFGPGGRYAATDLRARASMLETLEASIRLLYEQLEVLMREIADHAVEFSSAASS